jgi:hypothetical protein
MSHQAESPARGTRPSFPKKLSSFEGDDNPNIAPTAAPTQAPRAAVIPAAHRFRRPPPRRPALTIQISVRQANQPHGRSRPFSLSHDAFDRLLDTAARLERRP